MLVITDPFFYRTGGKLFHQDVPVVEVRIDSPIGKTQIGGKPTFDVFEDSEDEAIGSAGEGVPAQEGVFVESGLDFAQIGVVLEDFHGYYYYGFLKTTPALYATSVVHQKSKLPPGALPLLTRITCSLLQFKWA